MKGCSVGQFEDAGVAFGQFDCKYKDVCSRIERLVLNGYLKRKPDQPYMLEYVPDPIDRNSTPQGVNIIS